MVHRSLIPCLVHPLIIRGLLLVTSALLAQASQPERLVIASYNLENYLLREVEGRVAKSEPSRHQVHQVLLSIRPDVLAVQEVGDREALEALQEALRQGDWPMPHLEHVGGFDRAIHVGILSRHPIVERRSHTNLSYLIDGRRFRTSRGIAEVDLQVGSSYRFTLMTAHLKSKRPIAAADQAEMRHQEAIVLRRLIDERLRKRPTLNLVVCGDLNDTPDSPAIRAVIGRGQRALKDLRPAERNGDRREGTARQVTWTHFFAREDSYSRIDYLLVSPGMVPEWVPEGTYVPNLGDWGLASDHRPVVAEFIPIDR